MICFFLSRLPDDWEGLSASWVWRCLVEHFGQDQSARDLYFKGSQLADSDTFQFLKLYPGATIESRLREQ